MSLKTQILDSTKSTAISAAGAALTVFAPHQFWVDTKYLVHELFSNTELSSEEKHAKVSSALHQLFSHDLVPALELFGETFVDVAIKVAFMYVKSTLPAAAPVINALENAAETELNK